MTDPNSGTSVALQYVREEVAALSKRMDESMSGLRADISALAGEMRAHMSEQIPRMAVLEQRVNESEKDMAAIRTQHDADIVALRTQHDADIASLRESRRFSWGNWLAVALVILGSVLQWLLPMAGK